LNVALPAGATAGLAAPELAPELVARAGSAIIEIFAAAGPGADGGQDLVIDVTAAGGPPCTAPRLAPGCVAHAITKTTTSPSSTAPSRARRRRIRTPRSRLTGCLNRASGLACRAWPPGVNDAPAS